MINVVFFPYRPQYWDDAFVEPLFDGKSWVPPCQHEFKCFRHDLDKVPEGEGAVVVYSARAFVDHKCTLVDLNKLIKDLPWVLIIVTGDEEGRFPHNEIVHDNKKVWSQMARVGRSGIDRYLPCGYPVKTVEFFNAQPFPGRRKNDWFFSGQITHARRQQCVAQLRSMTGGNCVETQGFAQGLSQEEYYRQMMDAKIAICPAGNLIPDSFRLAEAMEAGCSPIVDYRATDNVPGYWEQVFQNPPFCYIDDWRELPNVVRTELEQWNDKSARIGAWWAAYKRQMAINLRDDINALLEARLIHRTLHDKITVVISSSPIPSHPSTKILEKTIASIRHHLPTCEILLLLDGVRPEQESRRAAYEEYKRAVVWKCQHEWNNILPVVFDQFEHQAGMMMKVIDGTAAQIHTPLLFFVEHDMQILPRPISWEIIVEAIDTGQVNSVRLYQQEDIIPVHQYLMYGQHGNLIRTSQYSQHPHVASIQFYHKMLSHFRPGCRTMIEDFAYTFIAERPWDQWKLAIYAPSGGYKRIEWVDGRESDPKYDMIF